MPKLILTEKTIADAQGGLPAGYSFVSRAEPRGDGTFDVPFSVHAWELLDEQRLAGESDDDLVRRVVLSKRPS